MQFMDYRNPITPPDPYGRYRIESVDREGLKQTGSGESPPPEDKSGLAAYLLNLLHKIFTRFMQTPGQTAKKGSIENLKSLKTAFETLKKEDRSEDIHFLNHLSKLWNHLLEDALQNSSLAEQTKALIKKIEHFPEHQLHTFGYYLSEFAGQKWIPFPYMELIQKLHTEHAKSPATSVLSEWTALLDQLLLKAE